MSVAPEHEPRPSPVHGAEAPSPTGPALASGDDAPPRTWEPGPLLGLLERFAFEDPALEAVRAALSAEAEPSPTRLAGFRERG